MTDEIDLVEMVKNLRASGRIHAVVKTISTAMGQVICNRYAKPYFNPSLQRERRALQRKVKKGKRK